MPGTEFTSGDGESEKLVTGESVVYNEEKHAFEFEDAINLPQKGLSCLSAFFFVVGNVLGAGIVTLPYAVKLASWLGIPIIVLVAVLTAICGVLLASITEEGVIEQKEDGVVTRDPYPLLAERAVGRKARLVVTIVLNITLALTALVMLLVAGEVFSKMAPFRIVHSSYRNQLRVWFVAAACFLWPFTLFGSPKEFWGVALVATVTSLVSFLLILVCLAMVRIYHVETPVYGGTNAANLFDSFGTIFLAFAGIGIFPTVQSDMKEPMKFTKVVAAGFGVIGLVYVIVSFTSFLILGNLIGEDLLTTLVGLSLYKDNKAYHAFVTIAQILICGHTMSGYVLNINPVHQQFEGYLGIPTVFCWQRGVIRTLSMVIILATALIIPDFGPVLSLLGGTFEVALCIIFPIWLYVAITSNVRLVTKLCLGVIVVLAIIEGAGNCFFEIKNIVAVVEGRYNTTI